MGNSCNGGCSNNSVGCCILNNLVDTLGNLFSTEPWCGNHGNGRSFANGFISGVNAAKASENWNNGNSGCGCSGNHNNNGLSRFANGFVSGVNALSDAENRGGCGCNGRNGNSCGCNGRNGNGCGCNGNGNNGCGCGRNTDLSSYTCCGNQSDAYYAQQYGLYPFNNSGCGCGCSCGWNN